MFINLIGNVNPKTIAELIFHIQNHSRPTFKQTPRETIELNVEEINLFINSPGGVPELGNSFYDFIKSLNNDITINTYNIGVVDSAAISIFCVGDKRYALPDSRFLIHESTIKTEGELKRIKDHVHSGIEATKKNISILSDVCKRRKKKVKEDVARHKYLSSPKAKKYGLIDDVVKTLPVPSDDDIIVSIAS